MRLEILKWNPINDEFGEIRASVYVKPTLEFLEFINRNSSNGNRSYMINISGTKNPIYDGMPYLGIVDKSSDVANYRQNFYKSTGLYIVMLSVRWFGYPETNGSIEFMEGIMTDTYGTQPIKDTPNVMDAKVEIGGGSQTVSVENTSDNSENKGSKGNESKGNESNDIKKSIENFEKLIFNENNENNSEHKKSKNYMLYLYVILFLIVLVYVVSIFSNLKPAQ